MGEFVAMRGRPTPIFSGRNALPSAPETRHDARMGKLKRLQDIYRFPGFVPMAEVRGIFGDPYAVAITLHRRRKKRAAGCAGGPAAPSTISAHAASATSPAATGGSTSALGAPGRLPPVRWREARGARLAGGQSALQQAVRLPRRQAMPGEHRPSHRRGVAPGAGTPSRSWTSGTCTSNCAAPAVPPRGSSASTRSPSARGIATASSSATWSGVGRSGFGGEDRSEAEPGTHYALSNAGTDVPLEELVRVRFGRHRIETGQADSTSSHRWCEAPDADDDRMYGLRTTCGLRPRRRMAWQPARGSGCGGRRPPAPGARTARSGCRRGRRSAARGRRSAAGRPRGPSRVAMLSACLPAAATAVRRASLGAERRSRTAARRSNHWHGTGIGCEDVIGCRLRPG